LPDGSSRLVVIWGLKVGKGRKDVKFIVDSTPPVVTVPPPASQPVKSQQETPLKNPAPTPTLTAVKITRPTPDTSHFEATPDVSGAVYSFVVTKSTGASMPQKVSIKGCSADVQLPPGAYSLQVRAFVGVQSSTLRQDFVVEATKARGKFWFVPWLILLLLLIAVAAFFGQGYRIKVYKIPYVCEFDKDRNGELNPTETNELVKAYDANGNGRIDKGEGEKLEKDLNNGKVSSTPYSVKHDKNKDGIIDGLERQGVFLEYDKNKDGVIDAQERQAIEADNKKLVAADKLLQDNPVPVIIIFDTDGDKKLSDDERKEALKKYDDDKDGVLNPHEIKKAEMDSKKSKEDSNGGNTNNVSQADTSSTNKLPSAASNGGITNSLSQADTSSTNKLPSAASNGGNTNNVSKADTSSTNKTPSAASNGGITIIVPPKIVDVTPKFDFAIYGKPERVGKSGEFNVTFKLKTFDRNATYTLKSDNTEMPFKEDRVTVPMKAGERKITVLEKKGDRSSEQSHSLEVSDKGFKEIIEDKGGDVKLK
jgi:Ca2+-binding EF-hand superfamily protein